MVAFRLYGLGSSCVPPSNLADMTTIVSRKEREVFLCISKDLQ